MSPENFNLRALERKVFRSVDELVDDAFSLRHREPLERVLASAFEGERGFGLQGVRVELVHQNFARLCGTYRLVEHAREGARGRTTMRDVEVVVEGLYDFSPRNWAFRLDVVHMRAESAEARSLAADVVESLLEQWKQLPSLGRFRYRKGVFVVALSPLPADEEQAAAV